MVLFDVLYHQNLENPHELDVLLKTNVGMWAYRNGMLVRDESYSLSSFESLPSIARLRKEHGALALSDMRTSQENDLYILLSGRAILAIENIPTPEGYIRELRVIESLDGENKADMEAFLGLEVASWFVPGKTSPHLQTSSRPKFDKQEKAVLTLTAISAFTGLHPSFPLLAISAVLIFITAIHNFSILTVVIGVFSSAIFIFVVLSLIFYYITEETKIKRLFPLAYVSINIVSIFVCALVVFPILERISSYIVIFFLANTFISLMTGYLTLKMKYAKEKRVLGESVSAYVIKRLRESLRS